MNRQRLPCRGDGHVIVLITLICCTPLHFRRPLLFDWFNRGSWFHHWVNRHNVTPYHRNFVFFLVIHLEYQSINRCLHERLQYYHCFWKVALWSFFTMQFTKAGELIWLPQTVWCIYIFLIIYSVGLELLFLFEPLGNVWRWRMSHHSKKVSFPNCMVWICNRCCTITSQKHGAVLIRDGWIVMLVHFPTIIHSTTDLCDSCLVHAT